MTKINQILNFHVLLKKLQNRRLTHANFYSFCFQKLKRMQKVKSNTFKNINYNIFQNNSRFVSKTSKILNFHIFLKKLQNLRLPHENFLFFSKNGKCEV